MTEVRILVTPNHIKTAASKAAESLKRLDYDALFLNFSRDLEEGIRELAEGAAYDYVLERIRKLKLIPEPLGSWEYGAEPILRAVRGVCLREPRLKIYCYKDSSVSLLSTQLAEKIALLIFRQCSTGKLDLEKWKKLLSSWLDLEKEALDREADFLVKEVKGKEASICIAGFNGKHINAHLKEAGYQVNLKYLYVPYHFTPLEVLVHEMQRGVSRDTSFSSERMRELIEQHAQFIRDYVIVGENYDKAYYNWMWNKIPWLRHRMITKIKSVHRGA